MAAPQKGPGSQVAAKPLAWMAASELNTTSACAAGTTTLSGTYAAAPVALLHGALYSTA